MTEIVINGCFGGFSLSHAGCEHYAKLKGLKIYRYFDASTKRIYGDKYRDGIAHYATKPIPGLKGDILPGDGTLFGKVTKESKFLNKHYWTCREIERDDPALVQTVRELGSKADGAHASLEIVGIPDGIEWEIDEYDGNEHIAEKHRTWR